MKVNQWTMGLAAAGVISFGAVAQAEEKPSNQVLTALSGTQISGYVSTSLHWNPGQQAGHGGTITRPSNIQGQNYVYNRPSPSYLANKGDGFNLDVIQLTFSKPLDEGEWSAGYVAEVWMGPDAVVLGNLLGDNDNANGAGGISLAQGYIALNVPVGNGITVKVGTFNTIIGYESNNSPENPNYSRSWGYTLGPFQHEGLVASYKIVDGVTITAGIANRQDTGLQSVAFRNRGTVTVGPGGDIISQSGEGAGTGVQSQKTYMAAISLTAPDSWGFLKGATLNAGVVDGISAAAGNSGPVPDITNIHVSTTIPTPIESIKLGFAWDHISVGGSANTIRIPDTDVYAFYASFSNLGIEKLKLNTRFEIVRLGQASGIKSTEDSSFGLQNAIAPQEVLPNLTSLTATLEYPLWNNVISRLEYRWDHDSSGFQSGPDRFQSGEPNGNGANNLHSVILSLVYKF